MKTQTKQPATSSTGRRGAAVLDSRSTTASFTLRTLRFMLLAVFVFGVLGAGIELILLEHTEDALQWIPLVLMSFGIIVAAWCAARPAWAGIRTMQGLMALYIVSGFVGVVLHYRGNAEFELEMYPSMGGMQLFWESIRGATPALSPGTMIVLGLIGCVYTFRHPATVRRDRAADANTGAL